MTLPLDQVIAYLDALAADDMIVTRTTLQQRLVDTLHTLLRRSGPWP